MSAKRHYRRLFRLNRAGAVGDEITFHLASRIDDLVQLGMSPEEARITAEREFGDRSRYHAETEALDREFDRSRRSREAVESFAADVRFAWRGLIARPGFALVSAITIALGIGATTAIYSVVDAVLLRPLPYPDAERLVVPRSMRLGTDERWNVTYRDFLTWQKDSAFESAAVYQWADLDITGVENCSGGGCQPERIDIGFISKDYFKALGVRPLVGRFPRADEFSPGSPRTLVISYGLWQRRFGGDPSAVGKRVRMTGLPVEIVGVLPKGTEYPREMDAWYPYRAPVDESTLAPDNAIFFGLARLRRDRSLEQTRARLATLAAAVSAEFPSKRRDMSVTAIPLRDYIVGPQIRRALWVLLGAVTFVLLIACVNVANLMLARATARERELSLRTALGAGRWRIVRQMLTESLVLAGIGGALGIAVAVALSRVLVAFAPADVLTIASDVRLNLPTLLVAAACTILSAILFGLTPAMRASAARPAEALTESGARTSGSRRQHRASAILVVAEVALSLTLLAGAGLLTRSLMKLRAVDVGLDVRNTLVFQAALPQGRYDDRAAIARFWDEYLRRLRTTSGVTAASVTTALPFQAGGFYLGRTLIEAGAPEPPAGTEVDIMWNEVGTQYFAATGHKLVAGREFDERDDTSATPRIIVTRAFAREMFPELTVNDVIGKRVFSWRDERVEREIIGVAADIRYDGSADRIRPLVFVPQRQSPRNAASVIVRGSASSGELVAAARRELASLDADIAMANVRTLEEALARTMAPQRFNSLLFGAFAMLALVLASIGLYGVMSYRVAQEGRQIGVRMALGATPGVVQRDVLARSLGMAAAGAVIGLVGSLVVTRALSSLLFEVQPTDVPTLGAVTLILLAVAAVAGWIPARRATTVDPAVTLRLE